MDHPILSITEFAEQFRRRALGLGYEDCEMVDLQPSQSRCWGSARAAFGVVIGGDAVIGNRHYAVVRCVCEEFEVHDGEGFHVLAGPEGVRLFVALLRPLSISALRRGVDLKVDLTGL